MTMFHDLTHRKARSAQVGLSYFFLAGFFGVLILEGVGVIKTNVSNNLREVLMLVMSFWFMRQRTSSEEPPQPVHTPNPSQPPPAAKP